jgi:hypothetical protein
MHHESAPIDRSTQPQPVVEIQVEARFEPVASATDDARAAGGAVGWRLLDVAQAPDDSASGLTIALFRDEAEGYYLNLTTAEPSIFVMWRVGESPWSAPDPVAVTLSYNEAARWLDAGERVDRVPMPAEVAAWLAEFAQRHYQPERGRKRRGTKPSFMDRREFEQMLERERGAAGRSGGAPGAGLPVDPDSGSSRGDR